MNQLDLAIKDAIEFLDDACFDNLELKYEQVKDTSELTIVRKGNKVTIKYGELVSLFRGLTYVKERKAESEYSFSFHKSFKHNGVMHDCSRNGALNFKKYKEFVVMHALLGMNMFMLYTEDLYEVEGEPFFGYLRGRYTKKEIKEMDEYAKMFGVELVPCIQTLSHLNQAIKWNAYSDRRDSNNTLLVDEPKTYEFIDKLIKTCSENFSSRNIHIGMDEAFDLGIGSFLYKNKLINKTESLLRHLNKVVEICQKYGMKPMMWEDMFFHLNGSSDWYNNKADLPEEVKKLIPDVGLVYWDYYHQNVKDYDNKFEASLATGKDVIFAGGAISWIGFAPNILESLKISRAGLKSALKHGVKSVFITSWGDNGNEAAVVSCYPAMALYSLYDYQGGCSNKELSDLLEVVTGDTLKRWATLQLPNKISPENQLPYENISKPFFYQDVLMGMFDNSARDELKDYYKKYTRVLKNAAKHSKKFGYVYQNLSNLCSVLELKVNIGRHLRSAYKAGDIEALKLCLVDLKKIQKRTEIFLESMRTQWDLENRPSGFDVIDGRIGYLLNRIKTAYRRVDDYVNKRIESVPELEEEIINWEGTPDGERLCVNTWTYIVSPNAI